MRCVQSARNLSVEEEEGKNVYNKDGVSRRGSGEGFTRGEKEEGNYG